MKNEGSILIEVIVGIAILTLATTFIVSTSIENLNMLKKRVLSEEVNRAVYNLMNEIKYNKSKDEIENLLIDGEVGLKYDENFSGKLLTKEIEDFEHGNDIKISKVSDDGIVLNMNIKAHVKKEKNEIIMEKNFNKSWWMDEI